jgi:AcrR family transcriptional regulator
MAGLEEVFAHDRQHPDVGGAAGAARRVAKHPIGELRRGQRALPAQARAARGVIEDQVRHFNDLRAWDAARRRSWYACQRVSYKCSGGKVAMSELLRKVREASFGTGMGDEASQQELRILKHALRSFAMRGYAATGLRAIAAEARLTAPMVNYYFKTKEVLYQRVAALVMEGLADEVAAGCPDDAPLIATLRGNLEGHLRFATEHPDAVAFVLGLIYGPEEGRPALDLEAMYAPVRNRVRRAFERAARSGILTLHEGISRSDAIEVYEGVVDALIGRCFKASRGHKPAITLRAAARRLRIVLTGLGLAGAEVAALGKDPADGVAT